MQIGMIGLGRMGSIMAKRLMRKGHECMVYDRASEAVEQLEAETASQTDSLDFQYDIQVAEVWCHGSVIGSWLPDLTAEALLRDPQMRGFQGRGSDSGEGRWSAIATVESGAPAPVLAAALFGRFASRDENDFADRALSAMRYGFGGHQEKSI